MDVQNYFICDQHVETLPSELPLLPKWQGHVEIELNLSIFNWKCEKMYYV